MNKAQIEVISEIGGSPVNGGRHGTHKCRNQGGYHYPKHPLWQKV